MTWIAVAVVPSVVISSVLTLQRVLPRFLESKIAEDPQLRPAIVERVSEVIVSDSWTLVVFVSFVACALYLRARATTHNRLMFQASAKLIAPTLSTGRPIGAAITPFLPEGLLPSTVFVGLCIAGLVWHDLAAKRRLEFATIWGSVVIGVVLVIARVMPHTELGIDFASWVSGVAIARQP